MATALLPSVAFAEDGNYGFSITSGENTITVTSDNAADILGSIDEGATLFYDVDSNTLTLENCQLTNSTSSAPAIYVYTAGQGLNLNLLGTNTISAVQSIVVNGDLKISGSGTLNVTGTTYAVHASGCVSIDGVTVSAANAGNDGAIQANNGTLTIQNGANVTASNTAGRGVSGEKGVTIQDSQVTSNVTAASGACAGILSGGTDMSVTNSTVVASSTSGMGITDVGGGIYLTDSIVNTATSSYGDYGLGSESSVFISGGTVTVTAEGSEANAICVFGLLSISDGGEVTAKATAADSYPAVYGEYGVSIDGSTVEVESKGDAGIFSDEGPVTLANGSVVTATGYWPAVRGNTGVTISDSKVNAVSTNDVAIFSPTNVQIENSIVEATGKSGTKGILSNTAAYVSNSWVTTSGDETFENNIADSVLFNGNSGNVIGSATVPGDVTVPAGATLTIPAGATLTVPDGVTMTNNGAIDLKGTFTKQDGGDTVCADGSHTGGTATCTEKAVCEVCGKAYGDLPPHQLTKTEAKDATCKVAGYEAYWTCSVCSKLFSDEDGATEINAPVVISTISHSYTGVVTPPTCTEQGYTTHTCSECGDSYVDTYTDALGHTYGDTWKSNADGHWHECTACGEKSDTAAHAFGDWTVAKAATATTAGSRERICTVCGYKVSETIAATGTNNTSTPQTGDSSNLTLWLALMLLTGAGLTGTLLYSRKRRLTK